MAKIDDIERRLLNWGRWKHGAGAGGLGYARVNPGLVRVDCDRSAEAIIPTNDCEAQDTDAAVMTLPGDLRATVEVYYVAGGSMAEKARRLVCTEVTIRNRIGRAHPLIQAAVVDLVQKRRAMRAEVEAAQQRARPSRSISDATFVDQMEQALKRRGPGSEQF